MDLKTSAAEVRKLITDGNTEEALAKLIALLESNKAYAELLRAVRVNQADWFQLKSQNIRNIISPEDARLASNQINDKILEVADLVEAGKFAFDAQETDEVPQVTQAWRYYLAGGIVTLAIALLGWNYCGKPGNRGLSSGDCPEYIGTKNWRIMILPFRQSGSAKTDDDQALEIAEGLNTLIEKTPGLENVVAKVHEKFDIQSKYPTPDEAAQICENCSAQMIVWGRINKEGSGNSYKLDVRYRVLKGPKTTFSGDTTLINLLKISDQGQLIRDLDAITKRLYNIIANTFSVPAEARAFRPLPLAALLSANPTDSLARDSIISKLYESIVGLDTSKRAEEIYEKILSLRPNDSVALVKSGTIHFAKGRYALALASWEKAAFNPEKADHNMLKNRVVAYEQTGDYDRSGKDLKAYAIKNPVDSSWIQETTARIETAREQKAAELSQITAKSSKTRGKPVNKIIADAKDLLKVSKYEEASNELKKLSAKDAQKPQAVALDVEIHQRRDGDEGGRAALEAANAKGVSTKDIAKTFPQVTQLEPPTQKKQ